MRRRTLFVILFAALIAGVALAAGLFVAFILLFRPLHGPGVSLLYDVSALDPASTASLSARTTIAGSILQKRLDPEKTGRIQITVVLPHRLQVWIDGNADSPKALSQFDAAQAAFQRTSLDMASVDALLTVPPADRDAALITLIPPTDARRPAVQEYLAAADALSAAEAEVQKLPVDQLPTELLAKVTDLRKSLNDKRRAIQEQNLTWPSFYAMLFAPTSGPKAPPPPDATELADRYPAQAGEIKAVIDAHAALVSAGIAQQLDFVTRMTAIRGKLEFRIAVDASTLSADDRAAAVHALLTDPTAPLPSIGGTAGRWFPVSPSATENFKYAPLLTAEAYNRVYVLLCDDPTHTLLHDPSKSDWNLEARFPYVEYDGTVLPFELDPAGARAMGDLTSKNLNRCMTILLDDQAFTAPTIRARINDAGVITFGPPTRATDTQREAQDLYLILNAGDLPAALTRVP